MDPLTTDSERGKGKGMVKGGEGDADDEELQGNSHVPSWQGVTEPSRPGSDNHVMTPSSRGEGRTGSAWYVQGREWGIETYTDFKVPQSKCFFYESTGCCVNK